MSRRWMKPAVLAAVGASLALLLAACGGDDATNTPTSSGQTPTGTSGAGTPTATSGGATATPTSAATPTEAFNAEAYFSGKTITMQVGFGQGGGTDRQARYFAANWGKYIPGKPKIEVLNTPPVLAERNRLWASKPDGFTLSTEATTGISDQTDDSAKFNMAEVTGIGATSGGDSFWVTWGDSLDYGCADTAMGKDSPIIRIADGIPQPSDLTGNAFAAGMAAKALDLPVQLVHVAGDTGSAAQKLMLERGETDSWLTATVWYQLPKTNPGWVAEGKLVPFLDVSVDGVHMGPNDEGDFNCGKLEDYAEGGKDNPTVKEFYQFNDPERAFAKNIIGPPGMDPNVRDTLRKALDDAMTDSEFVTGLEAASGIPTNYTPGEEFQTRLKNLADGFFSAEDRYRELQQEIYDTYKK